MYLKTTWNNINFAWTKVKVKWVHVICKEENKSLPIIVHKNVAFEITLRLM